VAIVTLNILPALASRDTCHIALKVPGGPTSRLDIKTILAAPGRRFVSDIARY
jgi:hypothetical protein